MRQVIKAAELARKLGISRRTTADWCRRDSKLAYKRGHSYYIRISELAKKPGMDIVAAILLGNSAWIKATDLARLANVPRRTVASWCLRRPQFAARIGRNWYIRPEILNVTTEQAAFLAYWAPQQRTAVQFAKTVSNLSTSEEEKGDD